MNRTFGDIKHLSFISRDIDKSLKYFVDVWNVAPWHVVRGIKFESSYKGKPSQINISVALASADGLEFEVIEQHDDGPSIYRDYLRVVPTGFHVQHMGLWAKDFAKSKAEALKRGWVAVQEGSPPSGQFCYLQHPTEPNLYLEISDCSPMKQGVRTAIRQASDAWDGTDPIREGLPRSA
jgi:hypothetical protein